MTFEESKKNILNLITAGNLFEAFEATDDLLEGQDDLKLKFNVIRDMYVFQDNNFNEVNYRMRYQVFIAALPAFMPVVAAKPVDDELDQLYKLLCTVDFETQTTYFSNIYPNKNVSAFLLYGENANDVKWLYHQLLYKEGLIVERPVSIDYTSNANTSFENLSQLLYDKFKIRDKDPVSLRFQIELYLQTLPLVIIIKYPGKKIAELKEFYQSFYELFSLLHTQVSKGRKPVIFLFVEDIVSEYTSLDKDYFLWHNDLKEGESYSRLAITESKPKIMDLAPIKKIDRVMVDTWINQRLFKPQLLAISCDPEKCLGLQKDGDSPFDVIQKLYDVLKTDNTKKPEQWLIH